MSRFFPRIRRRPAVFFLSVAWILFVSFVHGLQPLAAGERFKVVIDPGHGGRDLGVKGMKGIHEKDITLEIALKLAKRINRSPSMEAFLTRKTDRFISLSERVSSPREGGGDIFLSLHANGSFSEKASGVRIFYMSFDFKPKKRMPGSSKGTDDELGVILSVMARTELLKESGLLAETV